MGNKETAIYVLLIFVFISIAGLLDGRFYGVEIMRMLWLLVCSIVIFGCISNTQNIMTNQTNSTTLQTGSPINNNIRVEIYHFHGTHQCTSCIAVGELAEKTVNTYFKDELESGKLVFGHINGSVETLHLCPAKDETTKNLFELD